MKIFHNTKYKGEVIDMHQKQINAINDPFFKEEDDLSSPLHNPSLDLHNPFDRSRFPSQNPRLVNKKYSIPIDMAIPHRDSDHALPDTMGSLKARGSDDGGKNLFFGGDEVRRTSLLEEVSPASRFSKGDKSGSFAHNFNQLPELKEISHETHLSRDQETGSLLSLGKKKSVFEKTNILNTAVNQKQITSETPEKDSKKQPQIVESVIIPILELPLKSMNKAPSTIDLTKEGKKEPGDPKPEGLMLPFPLNDSHHN